MQLLYAEITQHLSDDSNAVMVTHKSTHEVHKTMDAMRYFMDPFKKSYTSRFPKVKNVFRFFSWTHRNLTVNYLLS